MIELQQVTKRYGSKRGIENINLTVEDGEIFGFIGPNGAGKSTTIRSMLMLLIPDSGQIKLFGDLIKVDRPDIRRRIGYLPSEVHYHPDMTGMQVLTFTASVYGLSLKQTEALLDAERLQLDLSKRVKSYSLGNRKKLGIVQSMMHEPRLLILDEPTSGLDPLMQQTFFDMLMERNKAGVTVFFSSHVLSEVEKLCSRVGFIRNGELIRVSGVDEIPGKDRRIVHVRYREEGNLIDTYRLHELDPQVTYEHGVHCFMLQGELHTALRTIAEHEMDDIRIEQPSLEQLFMSEYETDSTVVTGGRA